MCDHISEKEHQALRAKLEEWMKSEWSKIYGGHFEFASESMFIVGTLYGFTKVNNKETILHFSNKDVGFVRYVVGEQPTNQSDDTTIIDSEEQKTNLTKEEKQQSTPEQHEKDLKVESVDEEDLDDDEEDPRVSELLTEIQAIDYLATNDNDQKFLALVLVEWSFAPIPYKQAIQGDWHEKYKAPIRECSKKFIPYIQRARNMAELRERIKSWRKNSEFDVEANDPYINGILLRAFEKLKK